MKLAVVALSLLALVVGGSAAAGSPVVDLMMDLLITPIDAVPAPPLNVTTLDGQRVTLDDVRGRVVIVYFWATW